MVLNLVKGGSTEPEAKRIIAMRTTAFNKAIKDYKKTGKQVPKITRTCKHVLPYPPLNHDL
jgi:hypothetical protein